MTNKAANESQSIFQSKISGTLSIAVSGALALVVSAMAIFAHFATQAIDPMTTNVTKT